MSKRMKNRDVSITQQPPFLQETTEADGCQKNRLFFIYFFPLDESYIRSGAENPSRSMQVSSTSRTRSSSAR